MVIKLIVSILKRFHFMAKKFYIIFLILLTGGLKSSLGGEQLLLEETTPSGLTKITLKNNQCIYTKPVTLPSGETAYFACEQMFDRKRVNQWLDYRAATEHVAHIIVEALKNQLQLIDENFGEDNDGKKQELINLLINLKDPNKIIQAMGGTVSGAGGMECRKDYYITYISRKPVRDFFPLPELHDYSQRITLGPYMRLYDDLIMSVSSYPTEDINVTKLYQHRGIFRNPMSMLRKNYARVGLLIHAYTATVWSERHPIIELMMVNPDDNSMMRILLMDTFNSNEMSTSSLQYYTDLENYEFYLEKFIPTDQSPTLDESLKEKYGVDIIIKVEALKKRFSN
jgi:hypothetical protein